MGRKYSGHRPENKPVFVNPLDMDFEKRRMFVPITYGAPTPPVIVGRDYLRVKNSSGGELAAGDVVVLKNEAAGDEVTTTTTEGDPLVLGMVAETIADGAYGLIQVYGKTTKLKVDGTEDIAIGNFITTFTTAKIGMKASSGKIAFAIALEAYTTNDSSGVIDALIITPRVLSSVDFLLADGSVPLTGSLDFNLQQAVDMVVMTVANEAALPTEGIAVGQICFATAELTLHICTAIA